MRGCRWWGLRPAEPIVLGLIVIIWARRLVGVSLVTGSGRRGWGRGCPEAPPAAGAVVRDDGAEHREQGGTVDRVAAVDLDGPGGRVTVTLVDDAVRVGDGGVVDEDVDVVLRR